MKFRVLSQKEIDKVNNLYHSDCYCISDKSLNELEVCITFDSEQALKRKIIAYIFEEDKLYE